MKNHLILGAAIGDCVHVAGVVNFLNLAEQLGYETICLGPAIGVDELLDKVALHDPAIVAVGYRLTPENCRNLLRGAGGQGRGARRGPAHLAVRRHGALRRRRPRGGTVPA